MSDFRDPLPQDVQPANKNWLWILLIFGLPAGFFLCCCGGAGSLFFLGFSQVASSQTYTEAVQRAKNDPRVKELLGEPIKEGFSLNSNYVENNGVAEMTLQVPLNGPQGSATLKVKAGNHSGKWEYSQLEAQAAGGKVIDLLTDQEKGIEPPEKKVVNPEEKAE